MKFTAIAAITLDGKIAQHTHQFSFDWISKEDQAYFKAELKKYDAVIVGSNTFKTAIEALKKRSTIVLTSKVTNSVEKFPHVWFCNYKSVNLKTFVALLGFKKIAILGGSKVYAYCLEKNLLDKLCLTLEPVIFGTGIELFASRKFKLYNFKLDSVKKINRRGSLLIQYTKHP